MTGIPTATGFEDVHLEAIDGPVTVGATLDEAVNFQFALGSAGEVFREAGEEAERKRGRIEQALRDALAPYQQETGVVMPSGSWAITAKRPAE